MKVKFSNDYYKQKAIKVLSEKSDKSVISMENAFLVLINSIPKSQTDNLCNRISDALNISQDEAYLLTQQLNNNDYSKDILKCAYELVKESIKFGNELTEDNRFNKSSWLSHSFNNAIVCYNLAKATDLDPEKAWTYGLLHDYGRKYTHTFEHVVKGFEKLIDLGLENESRACLTHSFINKGRYSNNEIPENDFKLNNKGEEIITENSDDLARVLQKTVYNDYDNILRIADLTATDYGIVSPLERVKDISKRRSIDLINAPNRKYFLVSFSNLLRSTILKIEEGLDIPIIDINTDLNLVEKYFEKISKLFTDIYNKNYYEIKFNEKQNKK